MKVWKVTHPGVLQLEDLGPSKVTTNSVKVKMLSASISSTEKLVYNGSLDVDLPRVLGRQGAGMISEVDPSVTAFKRGDRVYVSSQVACGECYFCKTGKISECSHLLTHGKNTDGVLSDFAIISQDNLYLLPDANRVSNEEAVFIENIALAITTLNTLHISRGDHLAIVGASALGLIIAQIALYYQAVPILIDKRPENLALAEQSDIYYSINSQKEDVTKRIYSITGGKMAKRVIYTLDSEAMSIDKSFELVSKNAQYAFAGTDPDLENITANLKPLFDNSVTLYSINSTSENITAAINMLANKKVDVSNLMTVIPFDSVKDYVDRIANGEDFIQLVVKNEN